MNILFLGGAKRVSMARMFMSAARRLGSDCRIYSYEMTQRVPIAVVADVIVGLRWSDPGLYDDLSRVVRDHDINIVVPFVDGAVSVAARLASMFPGRVFAPTSPAALSEAMFDKAEAARRFAAAALPIPETYTPGMPSMPLIAKPRHGSASRGLVAVDDPAQLSHLPGGLDAYLVQRRIDRRQEYTVDCYVSVRDRRILAATPRLRVEVSGGEVTNTVTVDDAAIVRLAHDVLVTQGLVGAVTVQVLRDLDTGRLMVMEVNPRLGGGAVCSVLAGTDIPAMILADASGGDIAPAGYTPGVTIVRYPQEVAFVAHSVRPLSSERL